MKKVTQVMKQIGNVEISHAEFRMLIAIAAAHDEGSDVVAVGEVGKKIGMQSSNASHFCTRMCEKGFIKRVTTGKYALSKELKSYQTADSQTRKALDELKVLEEMKQEILNRINIAENVTQLRKTG